MNPMKMEHGSRKMFWFLLLMTISSTSGLQAWQILINNFAVGFTINHIAAVFVPASGGFLWLYSYKIPFLIGAGLSLASLLFTQFIRISEHAKVDAGRFGGTIRQERGRSADV